MLHYKPSFLGTFIYGNLHLVSPDFSQETSGIMACVTIWDPKVAFPVGWPWNYKLRFRGFMTRFFFCWGDGLRALMSRCLKVDPNSPGSSSIFILSISRKRGRRSDGARAIAQSFPETVGRRGGCCYGSHEGMETSWNILFQDLFQETSLAIVQPHFTRIWL